MRISKHEAYEGICRLFDKDDDADAIQDLLAYFRYTYIAREDQPPRYPIEMWNHYKSAIELSPKTTNATEGWHYCLQAYF